MREEQLLSYLQGACPGRKYRVSGAELEQALHISGTDLRKLVNRMRRKGIPISSDRSGYFFAVNAAEVYTTIRQLKQMVFGLEKAIAGLENSMEKFSSGEVFDGSGGDSL